MKLKPLHGLAIVIVSAALAVWLVLDVLPDAFKVAREYVVVCG